MLGVGTAVVTVDSFGKITLEFRPANANGEAGLSEIGQQSFDYGTITEQQARQVIVSAQSFQKGTQFELKRGRLDRNEYLKREAELGQRLATALQGSQGNPLVHLYAQLPSPPSFLHLGLNLQFAGLDILPWELLGWPKDLDGLSDANRVPLAVDERLSLYHIPKSAPVVEAAAAPQTTAVLTGPTRRSGELDGALLSVSAILEDVVAANSPSNAFEVCVTPAGQQRERDLNRTQIHQFLGHGGQTESTAHYEWVDGKILQVDEFASQLVKTAGPSDLCVVFSCHGPCNTTTEVNETTAYELLADKLPGSIIASWGHFSSSATPGVSAFIYGFIGLGHSADRALQLTRARLRDLELDALAGRESINCACDTVWYRFVCLTRDPGLFPGIDRFRLPEVVPAPDSEFIRRLQSIVETTDPAVGLRTIREAARESGGAPRFRTDKLVRVSDGTEVRPTTLESSGRAPRWLSAAAIDGLFKTPYDLLAGSPPGLESAGASECEIWRGWSAMRFSAGALLELARAPINKTEVET